MKTRTRHQIVVALSALSPGRMVTGEALSAILDLCRALPEGAEACAWSSDAYAFRFEKERVAEALRFAGQATQALVTNVPLFGVGIAEGELTLVETQSGDLGFGVPLSDALELAKLARAREVLVQVDASLAGVAMTLLEQGKARSAGRTIPYQRLRAGDVPKAESEQPPPAKETPFHFENEDSKARGVIDALIAGNGEVAERLIDELRERDPKDEKVNLLSGLLAVTRGAVSDAVRVLRAEAVSAHSPIERTRAHLAYAVALGASGRSENALFEALEALACARESGDRRGEQACAQFIANLSSNTGHFGAAMAWSRAAKGAS